MMDFPGAARAILAIPCQRHGCLWDAPEAHETCRAKQREAVEAARAEQVEAANARAAVVRKERPPSNRPCDCGSGLMVRMCNVCVERAVTAARAKQREADAKIADEMAREHREQGEDGAGQVEAVRRIACEFVAAAIRARGAA